jgi:hypothetical protein
MNFLAMLTALAGSPSVSPTISSMGLPLTPPSLLILSTAMVGHQFGGRADKRCRAGQVKKGADLDGIFRRSTLPPPRISMKAASRQSIHPLILSSFSTSFGCCLLLRFGGLVAIQELCVHRWFGSIKAATAG